MKSGKFDHVISHKYVLNDPLHQLFDTVKAISVQGYDEDRKVIYWNEGSEVLYGYSKEEATGQKIEDLIIPDPIRGLVISAHSDWINHGNDIPASEITLRHKDGSDVFVFSSHVMFINQFNIKQMYCIDVDLSDVRKAQAQAIFKEHMLETIFQAIPDLFFLLQEDGAVIDFHTSNECKYYDTPSELIGKNIAEVFPEDNANSFKLQMTEALKQKEMITFEFEQTKPEGVIYLEARVGHLVNYKQVMVIIRDITEQHKTAELIRHQAYFDSLTLLPNRFLALEQLSKSLAVAHNNNEKVAVLFVDLDDFKKINDSLGHEIGDKLLIKAAKRLQHLLPSDVTVGRLGGDEFIVILSELENQQAATIVAENLLHAFRQPLKIEGRELILTMSIGIATFPQDGNNASDLLRNADIAMYQAKTIGRNTHSFFTKEMSVLMQRRIEIEEQMHGALERKEFSIHYQPQFDVNQQKMIGAEALLRWHNVELGTVAPSEFIPIAEHTGLIVPIGKYVIEHGLNFLAKWQAAQNQKLNMAINLSPRQLRDVEFHSFLSNTLDKQGISPDNLEFEITEGVLMSGQSYIHEALVKISDLGIRLALDDFGTGYSSLNYLRQYPFDVLKIDRSFVHEIADNSENYDLVKAIVAMSHSLGLTVVAEGVETKEELTIVKHLGCDFVQGFYLSKPIPKKELLNFSDPFIKT